MNHFLHFRLKQNSVCKTNNAMKSSGRILILLMACVGWMPSQSQQVKSVLQLADQYFAAGEYYTAAHLYKQYLNPPKGQKSVSDFPLNIKSKRSIATNTASRTDILFKQAESYRLANYWQDAANSYKKCAVEDPLKYVDALYWYGVCQRSLGNYDAAEESLTQFLNTKGRKSSTYETAVEEELQTIGFIRQQLTRSDSVLFKTQKIGCAQ